jgi:DnaJ-class molecular chaperone
MSCTCIICGECHGSGTVRVDDWSQPEGFDLETCDECRGSGMSEICQECYDWREEQFGD